MGRVNTPLPASAARTGLHMPNVIQLPWYAVVFYAIFFLSIVAFLSFRVIIKMRTESSSKHLLENL